MIVFLDTEFTDLVIHPRLLSAALVAASGPWSGRDFYGEVTDTQRIEAAGWYALGAVLPQFGKVAHAACTYAELGVRLAAYFGDLVATLDTAEPVEVAYGYDLDWDLVELAIRDSGSPNWQATRRRIQPSNVYQVTGFGPAKLAAEAYFKRQAMAPFSRHHALCDARALRVAYDEHHRLAGLAHGFGTCQQGTSVHLQIPGEIHRGQHCAFRWPVGTCAPLLHLTGAGFCLFA